MSQLDWKLLHNACWEGDAAKVAVLLEAGADPNRVAPTGWRQRPLHRTLEFRITHPKHGGHVAVVEALLLPLPDGVFWPFSASSSHTMRTVQG